MRQIVASITLFLFIVYSQGTLVMWCIYQYEKHDIVLYYCAPNSTNGAEFVHRLTDNCKNERGASLVKLTERLVARVFVTESAKSVIEQAVVFVRPSNQPLPLSQMANPPSPPPKLLST
jgi:hypothetical protein